MANLPTSPTWSPDVYQIETADAVLGGPNGVINVQAKQLADRTAFLKQAVEAANATADQADSKADQALAQIDAIEIASGSASDNAMAALSHKQDAQAAQAFAEQASEAAQAAQSQAGDNAEYAVEAAGLATLKAQDAQVSATAAVSAASTAIGARNAALQAKADTQALRDGAVAGINSATTTGVAQVAAQRDSIIAAGETKKAEISALSAGSMVDITAARDITVAAKDVTVTKAAEAAVSAATATSQAGTATAQQALAASARVAAETARDAALIQSGVYATEALGRAAVADGVAFKVQGSGDVAAYEYRRTNSSTSVLIATYPSTAILVPVNRSDRFLGYSESDYSVATIGSTTASGSGVNANFWSKKDAPILDGWLRSVSIGMATGGSVQVLVLNASNVVTYDGTFAAPVGVKTILLGDVPVTAGSRPYIRPITGTLSYVSGGTDYSFVTSLYTGGIGSTISPAPAQTGFTMALEFSYISVPAASTVKSRLSTEESDIEAFKASGLVSGVSQFSYSDAEFTRGSAANTGAGATAGDYYWSPDVSELPLSSYLTHIEVNTTASGTGKIVVLANRVVQSVTDISIPSSGVQKLKLSTPVFVQVGGRVFFQPTNNILQYATGSGNNSAYLNGAPAAIVGRVIDYSVTTFQISIKLFYRPVAVTKLQDQLSAIDAKATGVLNQLASVRAARSPTTFWPAPGAPNIAYLAVGLDAGVELPVGTAITKISGDIGAKTGADKFYFHFAERATVATGRYNTEVSGPPKLLAIRTPAELGLTVEASGVQNFQLSIPTILVAAGRTYFFFVSCVSSTGASIGFALGEITGLAPETRDYRRGFYSSNAFDFSTLGTVPTSYESSFGVQYVAAGSANSVQYDDTITYSDIFLTANAAIAAGTAVISGTLVRNGVSSIKTGTVSVAATTGSNIRYDVIYYDREGDSFGVQAGTARTLDPSEAIPALSSSRYLPMFNVRVTSSDTTVVPVWSNTDRENRGVALAMEAERRRSRLYLPKTLAKIRKGAALKVASMGDSILAIQNTGLGTPSSATPNGAIRDRTYYFLESIGSDIVGTYPLYTATQLGWADDGAGAVHIAQSYVWQFVMALRATGQSISYDNFAIGGQATSGAVDGGGNPTAWLTNVINLSPDVVVLHFGMNERGNTGTENRMVQIINVLKNAGIEVIVNGCPNPIGGGGTAWEYTNRALERAAKYCNVAFVSMTALYDSRYIGTIGCTPSDMCSANRINHPGFNEHQRIGHEYIKLLMGAA